ncbi:hypothetical protein [Candidatus Electrothrix sp.]|uniref:hypothetical protein n=2 Tax=Candidatus Electrothrix sp. TaxID=2170559 RepID=UPI004055CBB0
MIQSKWFFRQIVPLLFLLILLSTTGCTVIPHKLGPFPEKQLIVTDGKGDMLKPFGNISREKNLYSSILELKHPIRCSQDKKDYLKKSAEEIAKQLGAGKDVVIYLHGGMNVQVKALKRAQDLLNYTKEHKQDAPYFVFINWQSSLYSSYRDRLFAIREGKDYRTYDGTTSLLKELPNDLAGLFFYLPADLLTGVARSPLSLERAFVNTHWFSLDNEINCYAAPDNNPL